jgi:hypothetical protein
LARAVVTLETERVKGSNPLCLWWWSFLWKFITMHTKTCISNFPWVSRLMSAHTLFQCYEALCKGRFIHICFCFLYYSLVNAQIYKILSAVTILQNFTKVNVKLSLWWQWRRMWEWKYGAAHSQPRQYMKLSG